MTTGRIKYFLFLLVIFSQFELYSQTTSWSFFADSISTYSSPHGHDINNDGVLDILIGGGKDGESSSSGVMAIDGETGLELWVAPSRNEVFGSAVFQDVTSDGVKDIFITGREAQFYALDGSDGSLLWDFFSIWDKSRR
jgi:outer membrane protein assembly factor BamB